MKHHHNWQLLNHARRGLTLLELVVVLAVMAAVAALIVPIYSNIVQDSRVTTTRSSLANLQDLIVNRYMTEMKNVFTASSSPLVVAGYPGPDPANLVPSGRIQNAQLNFLFVNPASYLSTPAFDPISRRGWNGPYMLTGQGGTYTVDTVRGFTTAYGVAGDFSPMDAWGNPIVIQFRTVNSVNVLVLVSAGPDGILEAAGSAIDLENAVTPDDIGVRLQ